MTSKIMTANQAFNFAMNAHPSLYSSDTLYEAKIKYFDHIFNTIGNGYRDINEFIYGHTINKKNKHLIDSFPDKYIGKEPLYMVYTKSRKIADFDMPVYESALDGLYTELELNDLPISAVKVQSNMKFPKDSIFTPYPNFSKDYSMVWRMDMSKLDPSWTEAAVWYYENIKPFFYSEDVVHYHEAVPNDLKLKTNLISSYEKNFERYRKDGMTDSDFFQAISDAYEQEYTGDTEGFINIRWEKNLENIKNFIDETIDLLKKQQS